MRRKDREVSEIGEQLAIIDRCSVCRLALQDEEGLYLLPLNFGYEYKEGKLVLYFHSARQGRKITAIGAGCQVAFEMDGAHQLITGNTACEYGFAFECVMGNGTASIVDDIAEKKHGLELLMQQQTRGVQPEGQQPDAPGACRQPAFVFTDQMAASVAVIKVEVRNFTAKRRNML
ncbi:MAG: pyridoxamine 5'-phosphate oxidase family protein [Lachnospiraceae bacterium]|nr:pyridoxamine 5'-phosphate oxidase family protein [Lachnospiraceae bacterium]